MATSSRPLGMIGGYTGLLSEPEEPFRKLRSGTTGMEEMGTSEKFPDVTLAE